MVDLDTFVIWLYVVVDDLCKTLEPERHPGPAGSLSRSEIITLAILSQWALFGSERRFYQAAQRRLGWAFPTLPDRSRFNRLVRQHTAAITRVALRLGSTVDATAVYEVMDSTGVRVRNAQRRGTGWLDGRANLGRCTRLGWYVGFNLLTVATPRGAITGFGFAPASTNDRHLADTLLAARHRPEAVPLPSAGSAHGDAYLADGNFWGPTWQNRWQTCYHAWVLAPPQLGTRFYATWSKEARRWLASHRQVIETVHDWLLVPFNLDAERPHTLTGFAARLAATVGLHNFCLWLNVQLGRPPLAVADLLAW